MDTKFIVNIVRRLSSKPTTNGDIKPFICNRNPRNLERLRIERKPTGYGLEKEFLSYWHKLNIISSASVTAQLIHNTEKVVVEASTNEWCIQKQLYSKNDSMAYIVLGKVFAERCLESGIISFACTYDLNQEENMKVGLFLNVLKEEGLILEEPGVYNIENIWKKSKEKRPWTVLED